MGKSAKAKKARQEEKSVQAILPALSLVGSLRRGLREFVIGAGLEAVQALLEEERTEVCGPRYEHNGEREATRGGHAPGHLVMGGRRVTVSRPRARTTDGHEVALPSWGQFAAEDPLHLRTLEQIAVGVTTRKYSRSLEPMDAELSESGTSKSPVSRRFIATTTKQLKEWLKRDLGQLSLAAVYIDGLHVTDHVVLVALGLDENGRKHVLGLWEGTTENATACKALLQNLVDRGISTSRSLLFAIDGSKALASAIRHFWQERAFVQRCQVHKKRNVLDQLPEQLKSSVRQTMNQAYASENCKTAMRILENLASSLSNQHPGAAASLEEGLRETLTVVELGLPHALLRSVATTNPIENFNGSVRTTTRNVKRWRGGTMILRWAALAVHEASRGFRRIKGYRSLPILIQSLRANDAKIDQKTQQKLDERRRVA